MKKILKLQKKSSINFQFQIIIIVFLIVILTLIMLFHFNRRLTPLINQIAEQRLNEQVYDIINNNVNKYVIKNHNILEQTIIISKNQKDEIVMLDFNLKEAYTLLQNITQNIRTKLKPGSMDTGFYLEIPLGQVLNQSFWSNLGPKIPLKINFTGTLLANLKTKITDYGMNNALVELYASLLITEQIMTPVVKKVIKTPYYILLASKLINGKVPTYYGSVYERESQLFNILK